MANWEGRGNERKNKKKNLRIRLRLRAVPAVRPVKLRHGLCYIIIVITITITITIVIMIMIMVIIIIACAATLSFLGHGAMGRYDYAVKYTRFFFLLFFLRPEVVTDDDDIKSSFNTIPIHIYEYIRCAYGAFCTFAIGNGVHVRYDNVICTHTSETTWSNKFDKSIDDDETSVKGSNVIRPDDADVERVREKKHIQPNILVIHFQTYRMHPLRI